MASKDSNHRDFDTSFDFDKLFEGVNFDEKIKDKTSFNSSVFSYLKDALISFIERNTKHHLIIGLTGKWGSGKTSFCKYLEHSLNKESNSNDRKSSEEADSKNNDNLSSFEESNKEINRNPSNSTQNVNKREYVFFFYDLWTHQHETFRKSILSELTSYLLDKEVLKNKCSIHPNESLFEWMKKTNVGSIYNHVKSTIYPILGFAFIGYLLLLFNNNIFSITSLLKKSYGSLNHFITDIGCFGEYCYLLKQLCVPIGFFLLLLALGAIFYVVFFRSKFVLGAFSRGYSYFFSKSSFKSILSTNNNDLSFADMRFWVKTLISNIRENTTIIVVLDNLDRLDGSIVKELFSSVHELFSELNVSDEHNKKDLNSISDLKNQVKNLHLIIPFDYSYLLEIYPSSMQSQHGFSNVIASLNAGFSSIHSDLRASGEKSEGAKGDNSTELKDSKTSNVYSDLQSDVSTFFSNFNVQSTLLNDYLDKTFSAIFYLPHVNPFNFYSIFEDKLSKILGKWCENLKFYNYEQGLFFEYIEMQGQNFSRKPINHDEFCKAIKEFENNELKTIIKSCWQILRLNIEKKHFGFNTNSNIDNNTSIPSKSLNAPLFNEINIRKIFSFIRDFAVILQINSRILFIDKTLGLKKIPLYVALYCRYISFFRSLGFADVLNIIGEQWRIKRLGIYEDISKRSSFTTTENEDYQYFVLYTNLEIIYYQSSFDKLTDELYTETLIDAFRLNRYVILLYKLNTSYFAENTRDVLTYLLENKDNDFVKIINFFEKALSDDLLFAQEERNLEIWSEIYCQFLLFFSEYLLFDSKNRSDLFNARHFYEQLYAFLDKILDSKIKNDSSNYKKFLELMISFLRILVFQFTYFNDPESISFFIYCVENYIKKNQVFYALKTEGYSSNEVENTLNKDFISLPVYLKNDVSFDADKKQCNIYVGGEKVDVLVYRLKESPDLLDDINRLSLVFFIKDTHRNTPNLTLLYSYPISKKMRLFYINHFDFSLENQQNLITLFCELTKWFIDANKLDYELTHRIPKSEIRSEERNDNSIKFCKSIIRFLYIYVLLASKAFTDSSLFICSDFFEKLEDNSKSILAKHGLLSFYEERKIMNSIDISVFPPFVRLLLLIIVKLDINFESLFQSSLDKSETLENKQEVVGPVSDNTGSASNNEVHGAVNQTYTFSKNDQNEKVPLSDEEICIIDSIKYILKADDYKSDKIDLNDLLSSVNDKDELFYLKWLISWKWNLFDKTVCL